MDAELGVTLSNDRMMAYVSGTVPADASPERVEQAVKELLARNGVVYGVKDSLLETLVSDLCAFKQVGPTIAATGHNPRPQSPSDPQFVVPTVEEQDIPDTWSGGADAAVPYHQLLRHARRPHIVREGETVGRFLKPAQAATGVNVLGESVAVDTPAGSCAELGDGLVARPDSPAIVATRTGMIVRRKKHARILPVNLDGSGTVTVSADRLQAVLEVFPPGPGGKPVDMRDVMEMLKAQSVVYGIREDDTAAALDSAAGLVTGSVEVVAAQGAAARPGQNARVDYQVDLSFSHRPRIRPDGSADYFSIHVFESVEQGQVLGTVVPSTPGEPGKDVLGRHLDAPSGRDVPITVGKNVEPLKGDPNTLVSAISGNVYLRRACLLVEEVMRVGSSVDFSTGNIAFAGDVEIQGDVLSGFSVSATGNVSIAGTVEDATVESDESVIVHGGFMGHGKGRIKSGHDVVVKHVRNQTIMARNNILVAGECVDAKLYAGNEMFVEVKKSWIMGGAAVARNRIRAYAIGSSGHVVTEVCVGVDMFLEKMLEELEHETLLLEEELAAIRENEARLAQSGPSASDTAAEKARLQAQFREIRRRREQKLKQLAKYRAGRQRSLCDDRGDIGVVDTIYPGVAIQIGHHRQLVSDELRRCLYSVVGGRIVVTALRWPEGRT